MNRPINNAVNVAARKSGMAGSEHTNQIGERSSHRQNSTTQRNGGNSSRSHTRGMAHSSAATSPVRVRLADDRAPWRVQMQVAGSILLGLVVMAVVALFYLNVSAKTAALGRQIQFYTVRLDGPHRVTVDDPEGTIIPIEEIDIQIAGLRARLAELNSLERIERRAQEMGFKPLDVNSIVYLRVPGYQPRKAIRLAPEPAPQVATITNVLPAYRSTLIDAVSQGWSSMVNKVMAAVISAGTPAEQVQP